MRAARRSPVWLGLVTGLWATASPAETTVSLSLVNPGPNTVQSGTEVQLEIRATFNTRLSAVSLHLSAAGDTFLALVDRSANPDTASGLTYVSQTSQDPFDCDLPRELVATPSIEVLFDKDFDGIPGGATDGLPAGANVLIEEITVVPLGVGQVTLTLSAVQAVHTTGPLLGALFDIADVGTGAVVLDVEAGGPGDVDDDGFVSSADHAQFPACMTGPEGGPVSAPCDAFRFDPDDDLDMRDVAGFQRAFNDKTFPWFRACQVDSPSRPVGKESPSRVAPASSR